MQFPTLYGRSSNDKIKVWSTSSVQHADGTASIVTEHGYLGGKMQRAEKLVKVGKNIGKANETTPYEQATSEAQSAWNLKRDGGYVEDQDAIPRAKDVEFFLPMLAHRFDKRSKDIRFPAYVQPKLDGARCLARKKDGEVKMWSRKGKVFDVPDRIKGELHDVLSEGESVDGELYVHGWDFQRIISSVKKKSDDTDALEYHVYDRPHEDYGFHQRFVEAPIEATDRVKLVHTSLVFARQEVAKRSSEFIMRGYEGLMVRNMHGLYVFKNRSKDLQKVKEFEDEEFTITGGREATGKDTGTIVFQCETESGATFDVRPKGSWEQRAEYWKNLDKYVGSMLTVRFQGLTQDGVPRFPVGLHIRPTWDK